jgi:hypothetical protein
MSCELISRAERSEQHKKKEKQKPEVEQEKVPVKNQGKLLLDATVADQMIVHPTDLGLVSKSREESEWIIDLLCQGLEVRIKPRTYRRKARKQYLSIAKKKHKTRKQIRKAWGNSSVTCDGTLSI